MRKLKRSDRKLLKMDRSENQKNINIDKLKSITENVELPYINNTNKLERKASIKIERSGSNYDENKESKVKRLKSTRRFTTHSQSQKSSIFDTEQDVYNKNYQKNFSLGGDFISEESNK